MLRACTGSPVQYEQTVKTGARVHRCSMSKQSRSGAGPCAAVACMVFSVGFFFNINAAFWRGPRP